MTKQIKIPIEQRKIIIIDMNLGNFISETRFFGTFSIFDEHFD